MNTKIQGRRRNALMWLAAFVLWTAAVCLVDVQGIGPGGSAVGLASVNGAFHRWMGTHMSLYIVTDWLSLVPVGVMAWSAFTGLGQWIRRKSILKVDRSILALGGFYLAVMAVYVLFEQLAINHRPVLIDGVLEASYPSSTTVLVLCVMKTALLRLRTGMKDGWLRRLLQAVMTVFTAMMVVGRLVSGVHWLSDIVGGVLLSVGLAKLYHVVCGLE